jgi:hypothetical protein
MKFGQQFGNSLPLIAGNSRSDDRQVVAANLSILNDEFSPDTRQHGLTPVFWGSSSCRSRLAIRGAIRS